VKEVQKQKNKKRERKKREGDCLGREKGYREKR
jgi:hypothetical protein